MFETSIDYSIPYMAELYQEPNIESKNWILRTFEVTNDDWYHIVHHGILPGKYVSLNSKNNTFFENTCMMSDTPMERFTNQDFINMAEDRVLIAGLGIGMVPVTLAQKDEIKHITVIEIDSEIIELVEPLIRKYVPNHEKIEIIQADAYEFPKTYTGKKYDYLWLDIWPEFPNTEADVEMFESLFDIYGPIMTAPRMNGWGYEYATQVGFGMNEINPIETYAFKEYCEELLLEKQIKKILLEKNE